MSKGKKVPLKCLNLRKVENEEGRLEEGTIVSEMCCTRQVRVGFLKRKLGYNE